jgi:hypothetical protein
VFLIMSDLTSIPGFRAVELQSLAFMTLGLREGLPAELGG